MRLPVLTLSLFCISTFAQLVNAELISNGDFSTGSFAMEGDDNFIVFGDGFAGTLVAPGESILTDWDVSLSEFDADQALTVDPPGLEWTDAAENDRWVDFNRGGDLWKISQNLDTITGQRYRLTHDLLSGPFDGGATLRIAIVGGTTQVFDRTSDSSGANRFDQFSFTFIADASTTVLNLSAIGIGPNEFTGPQVSNISITAVPEPSCVSLLVFGLMGGLLRRRTHRC